MVVAIQYHMQAAEQEYAQAINEHNQICDDWSNSLDDQVAVYRGKQDSLGGALDLGGDLSVMRNQINLDMDRFNLECAGEETHFYEENN